MYLFNLETEAMKEGYQIAKVENTSETNQELFKKNI